MEYFYHYTNLINMKDILKSGALKLTPSNLKKPKDLHRGINQFGKHALISETDSYKPVVWLTNSASSQQHGLELPMPSIPPEYDKKRIRFVLEKKPDYQWWHTWSDQNRMDKSYKKRLTTGMNYASWYICEHEIPLSDVLYVEDLKTGEIYLDNRTETE